MASGQFCSESRRIRRFFFGLGETSRRLALGFAPKALFHANAGTGAKVRSIRSAYSALKGHSFHGGLTAGSAVRDPSAPLGVTERYDSHGRRFISTRVRAWATRLVGFSIQRADDLGPIESGAKCGHSQPEAGQGYQAGPFSVKVG